MKYLSAFIIPLMVSSMNANTITLEELYKKFNMRTIYSSYGQRLKFYCESYPHQYFKKENLQLISNKKMKLTSNDDIWLFEILDNNNISITNLILSGSYNNTSEYKIVYKKESNDWHATEGIFIEIVNNCEFYKKNL